MVRGGPGAPPDASHVSGAAPTGPLTGDPSGPAWGGHVWSSWTPARATRITTGTSGLYRIRRPGAARLSYIGQGRVGSRVLAHAAKGADPTHRQSAAFVDPSRLELSFVLGVLWSPRHLLELENDLIAAHVLILGAVPEAQFLG